jgi:hypothetical protein
MRLVLPDEAVCHVEQFVSCCDDIHDVKPLCEQCRKNTEVVAKARAAAGLGRRGAVLDLVVVDDSVRRREVQPFMASVRPLDEVGRAAFGAANLEDFSVPSGRVIVCTTNQDSISD